MLDDKFKRNIISQIHGKCAFVQIQLLLVNQNQV